MAAQNRVGLCKSLIHTQPHIYKSIIQERGESECAPVGLVMRHTKDFIS